MRGKYLMVLVLLVPVLLLSGCGDVAKAAVPAAGGDAAKAPAAASYAGQVIPPVYGSYTPGLTVVGTGTVEADPDIAYVTLGVDLKATDSAAVVADATARMERVLAAIKAAGIEDKDVHTASYYVYVEQRYDPQTGQPTGVVDYHIMHSVRITVRDLTKVGTLLSAAVEAGANSISEVSFSVADTDKLATEARKRAIQDAQKRAQEMAGTLGITLGKVVSVSESGGYTPPIYEMAGGGADAVKMAAAPVPMPAGSFSVSISVVVIYELP